jgi:hypothetical protein
MRFTKNQLIAGGFAILFVAISYAINQPLLFLFSPLLAIVALVLVDAYGSVRRWSDRRRQDRDASARNGDN